LIHPTETHVFRDSEELFKAKHDTFMDMYLGDCLLGGDALNHTNLDEVVMIHKDDQDSVFCSRILNGIINSQSLIKVLSKSIKTSEIIFDIFYLNNYEDIEDFYCLKTTFDFLVEGVMLYQIFEVEVKSLTMLNDFWITNE